MSLYNIFHCHSIFRHYHATIASHKSFSLIIFIFIASRMILTSDILVIAWSKKLNKPVLFGEVRTINSSLPLNHHETRKNILSIKYVFFQSVSFCLLSICSDIFILGNCNTDWCTRSVAFRVMDVLRSLLGEAGSDVNLGGGAPQCGMPFDLGGKSPMSVGH